MRTLVCFLLVLLAAASRTAAQPAIAPASDVILRSDGAEIAGRVVAITPVSVRYLPPASADTLRLAAAEVFMVRYANGTREVLHPAMAATSAAHNAAPDLLPGLDDAERTALGRRDARRNYRSSGPFWGALGGSFYGGPVFGLIAPVVIAPHAIAPQHLGAPQPELLPDHAYGNAYGQEAQRLKRNRTWAGYATGSALSMALLYVLLANSPSF